MIFKKKGIGKLNPISFCVENKKKERNQSKYEFIWRNFD